MYPATEKEVIRNHISYICRKQHCADTFVLYLNSPTRNDGTMLLWDRNNNGIVSLWDFRNITIQLTELGVNVRINNGSVWSERTVTGMGYFASGDQRDMLRVNH